MHSGVQLPHMRLLFTSQDTAPQSPWQFRKHNENAAFQNQLLDCLGQTMVYVT